MMFRFSSDPYNCGFKLDSSELPSNSDTEYEMGNLGHRPRTKGGYFPVPPVDSCQDIRSEMLSVMKDMGVGVEKHHHEVASAQHELGMKFNTLLKVADHVQIYKYAVHNVAHAYGKSATFMPKPVLVIMVLVCTFTNQFGKMALQFLLAINMLTYLKLAYTTSAVS